MLLAIAISVCLGIAFGCWLTSRSITWMISKGVIDLFYNGVRSDEFRWW